MARAGKQGARRLANAATRRELALDLYVQGKTFQQIANALDYADRGSAHRAVYTALSESATRTAELAEHAREVVATRLQRLYGKWEPRALDGDPRAAALCMQMLDRYSKIHGLDRFQVETTVTTRTELDAEIEELVRLLSSRQTTPTPPKEN
ncbi:hypothetical protein [Nocardia farcinica]